MELRDRIPVLVALIAAMVVPCAVAGQVRVHGRVVDGVSGEALPSATVVLTSLVDSSRVGVASDSGGRFEVEGKLGRGVLTVNFLGYEGFSRELSVRGRGVNVGEIRLEALSRELDEVRAEGVVRRQELRGDTTVFNAAAFKMSPDATTEDLLKKLPGMQVKNGTITHGGEEVKKVLVDGKEYFGSNTSMAVRNIDADMVDKIEVFDKQSEQSEFTGISDGEEERTINILTKTKFSGGKFGQAYGGYGTSGHYEGGVTANLMGDVHRVSVVGQANDVGQQGYSREGQQQNNAPRGKVSSANAGVNYSLNKEKEITVETSYDFNRNSSENHSESEQEYFVGSDGEMPQVYDSESDSHTKNVAHDASLLLRWTIDTLNAITVASEWAIADNTSSSSNSGQDTRSDIAIRATSRRADSDSRHQTFRGELTYKRRLNKPRRTLSVSARFVPDVTDADATSSNVQKNDKTSLYTDQITDSKSEERDFGWRVTYTEPLTSRLSLMANYTPQMSLRSIDKTVVADSARDEQVVTLDNHQFSPQLSNDLESRYVVHRGGVSLNFRHEKSVHAALTVDFQDAILDAEQSYPIAIDTRRTFFSLMPRVDIRLGKRRTNVFTLAYSTTTKAPSVTQLQEVVDVSNIRHYSSGNPNLRQSYTHSFRMAGSLNDREASRVIFLHSNIRLTNNYIASASYMAETDSVIENGVTLPAGTQYTKPVNMDGMANVSLVLNASSPVKCLGSTLNLSLKANLSKTPGIYKGINMTSKSYALGGGLNLVSSMSENVDFNVGYDMTYNILRNSQTAERNYNYYNHSINIDLRLNFFSQHLFVNNYLAHNMTYGMGQDFDTNNLMWNATLGGRFPKSRKAELRLRFSDILNQAQSRNRSVGTASVTTSTQSVMGRYAMLSFVYKFKDFNGNTNHQPHPDNQRPMGPPPPRF